MFYNCIALLVRFKINCSHDAVFSRYRPRWYVPKLLTLDTPWSTLKDKIGVTYHYDGLTSTPCRHKSTETGQLAPPLQWRHNERDGVSNHQPHDCLLNRLFRRRSKKTSKLRVTGLWRGIHRWPVNYPHKWPVTRKMFPFDGVIMTNCPDW